MTLPCLAIICFTCFAACRTQKHKAFKALAYACSSLGLVYAKARENPRPVIPAGALSAVHSAGFEPATF
jgi:hypothetical protein